MKFKFKRYLALFLTIMLMLSTNFSTIVKAEGEVSGSDGQDCTLCVKILDKLGGESIAEIDSIKIFYLNGDWGFGNVINGSSIVTSKGNCILTATVNDYANKESYYFTKELILKEGENALELKESDLVPNTVHFTFDNSSWNNIGVHIQNMIDTNNEIKLSESWIGSVDENGNKTIYTEPGRYRIYAEQREEIDGKLVKATYLSKDITIYNMSTEPNANSNIINLDWSSNDTGNVKFNFGIDAQKAIKPIIEFDGIWTQIDTDTVLALNSGNHRFSSVSFEYNKNQYNYWKTSNQAEETNVTKEVTTLDFDISKVNLVIEDTQENVIHVNKGQDVNLHTSLYTKTQENADNLRLSFNPDEEWGKVNVVIKAQDSTVIKEFKDMDCGNVHFATSEIPAGTYIIEITQNLGPLYSAPVTVSKQLVIDENNYQTTYSIAVDKQILKNNADNLVNFTVTKDGQPVNNATVRIFEFGEKTVQTDSEGKATLNIHPDHSASITVFVNDSFCGQQLFVLENNEGVVKVNPLSLDSNAIGGEIWILCERGSWGSSFNGNPIYFRIPVVPLNLNLALYSEATSYYYVDKGITIEAGKVNEINLDKTKMTQVNIKYTLDGEPVHRDLFMKTTDPIFSEMGYDGYLGNVDNDGRVVYATPGMYKAMLNDRDENNFERRLVSSEFTIVNTIQDYTINFDGTNVGKFNMNITKPSTSVESKYNYFNARTEDFYLPVNGNDTILNCGSYKLSELNFEYEGEFYNIYENNGEKNFQISKDDTTTLCFDMSQAVLKIYTVDKINAGEGFVINTQPVMKNEIGYSVWTDKLNENNMTISLIDKDNKEVYCKQNSNLREDIQLPSSILPGTYTLRVTKDSGSLYGIMEGEKPITVVAPYNISVDKSVLITGNSGDVTITVKDGTTPVSGVTVRTSEGDNALQGTTDKNGQVKFNVNADYERRIDLIVNGEYYKNLIFVVNEGDGVVRVNPSQLNAPGNIAADFSIFNDGITDDHTDDGQILAGIVKAGTSFVKFAGWIDYLPNSYYITKNVDVVSGQIVDVDLKSSTLKPMNLTFRLDNSPLNKCNLRIKGIGDDFESYVGSIFDGNVLLYANPGNYQLSTEGWGNDHTYLMKNSVSLSEGDNNIRWTSDNLQKLNVNFGEATFEGFEKIIKVNNASIDFTNTNSVNITKGSYKVDGINIRKKSNVSGDDNNDFVEYNFHKNTLDNITIGTEESNFTADLTIDKAYMGIAGNENTLFFWPSIITKSGYDCDVWTPMNKLSDVNITKPDSKTGTPIINNNCGQYPISDTDPAGTYTISGKMDFGPLYGQIPVTGTYEYSKDISVRVVNAKPSYKLGEQANITVEASNYSGTDREATLIVAIFDSNGSMVNFGASSQEIENNKSVNLSVMLTLPEAGENDQYTIKCFVWDSLENMVPLTSPIVIPVIK